MLHTKAHAIHMIAFLDTSVLREPYGRLTTSVYRKPTHTDQYLAYDSHHPQSVKRGIVKCLYNRAKHFVTKQSVIMVISEEKKHLSSLVFLFQTVIPPPSSGSSPGHEKQHPGDILRQSLSPLQLCRMSKE